MAEKHGSFDATAFYAALDATRDAKSKNWKQVAGESGVSASTLTRMAQGKRPDVDSLAKLLRWSGLNPSDYLLSEKRAAGEPMAQISTLLKSDRNLSPESASALDKIIRAAYKQFRDNA
jgi:transcriptional regulator with XRE-family HTH domain